MFLFLRGAVPDGMERLFLSRRTLASKTTTQPDGYRKCLRNTNWHWSCNRCRWTPIQRIGIKTETGLPEQMIESSVRARSRILWCCVSEGFRAFLVAVVQKTLGGFLHFNRPLAGGQRQKALRHPTLTFCDQITHFFFREVSG